jgi:hypothetical protein
MNLNQRAAALIPLHKELQIIKLEDDGVPGWFSQQDKDTYRRLFNALPDNGKALETGCFLGRSLASVADIIIRKNISVYAVDLFNLETWGLGWKELVSGSHYNTFLKTMREHGLENNVCAISQSNLVAHRFFDDSTMDFIFIDTLHEYEQLTKEIDFYKRKLKPSGVMAGHDHNSAFPGVELAVKEKFGDKYILDGITWIIEANKIQ